MDTWLIVLFCILAVIVLHIIINLKKIAVLAIITVLLHIGLFIMLLLFEATLQQVFVFIASSVAANMLIRLIIIRVRSKQKIDDVFKNENAFVAMTEDKEEQK